MSPLVLAQTQVLDIEAWIGLAVVGVIFSLVVLVPLFVMPTQLPKLWRDRRYGLFSLIAGIWAFSMFTVLWITVPMVVAIWVPYPTR
jgi:hypothetical protein